jgi:hypothetical protein
MLYNFFDVFFFNKESHYGQLVCERICFTLQIRITSLSDNIDLPHYFLFEHLNIQLLQIQTHCCKNSTEYHNVKSNYVSLYLVK